MASTGQESEFDYGIKNNAALEIASPISFSVTESDGTQGKSSSLAFINHLSSGLRNGGVITIASPSSVNLSTGDGLVVDNAITPPLKTDVVWDTLSNVTVTNLTTAGTSFFFNALGNLVQQSIETMSDPVSIRNLVYVGSVGHPNGIVINVFANPVVSINPSSDLNDLATAIGTFSVSGNRISKIIGGLTLFKSGGRSYYHGANFQINKNSPNSFVVPQFNGGILSYVKSDVFLGPTSASINTTQYDLLTVLTTLSNNYFVAHRIFHQPSANLLFFQYGQNQYANLDAAKIGYKSENFISPAILSQGAYHVATIIVKKGETNLDSLTNSFIIAESKFASSGGGGGGGLAVFQSVYDNSPQPQIITTLANGAIQVRGGTGVNTDKLTEGLNNSGTLTSSIDANGLNTATSFVKASAAATNILLAGGSDIAQLSLPISTSVQTSLNSKADLVGGLVPPSQLPSYVDDVLEFDNLASFPTIGEVGKIYIAIDSSKQYRWTGSAYLQITNGLIASTNDVPEGINNLYFTATRVLANLLTGFSNAPTLPLVISATDSIILAFSKLQAQINGKAPSSGSANYIQNGTAEQTASLNISGNGTFGGNVVIGNSTSTRKFSIGGSTNALQSFKDNVNSITVGSDNQASFIIFDDNAVAYRVKVKSNGEFLINNLVGTGTRNVQALADGTLIANTTVYIEGDNELEQTASIFISGSGVFGSRVTANNYRIPALNPTPSSASATGTLGEIRYDANYIYLCVANNTWKRSLLTTW